MKEIRFAWVCRNIHFNNIERVELTDTMLLSGARPSWITSPNCEVLAKILPTGFFDKNNKEIWEGDIVQWDKKSYPVFWSNKMNQYLLGVSEACMVMLRARSPYYAVIGNIWEAQKTEEL